MHIWEIPKEDQEKFLLACLIDKYYEYEAAGGMLHVVLDDGNYDCVKACLADCENNNDVFGKAIGNLLLNLSHEEIEELMEERYKLHEKYNHLF
jgi:hypothetical protein